MLSATSATGSLVVYLFAGTLRNVPKLDHKIVTAIAKELPGAIIVLLIVSEE